MAGAPVGCAVDVEGDAAAGRRREPRQDRDGAGILDPVPLRARGGRGGRGEGGRERETGKEMEGGWEEEGEREFIHNTNLVQLPP